MLTFLISGWTAHWLHGHWIRGKSLMFREIKLGKPFMRFSAVVFRFNLAEINVLSTHITIKTHVISVTPRN